LRNSLSPIFAQSEKLGRKTKKLIRTRLAFWNVSSLLLFVLHH
jgi:hypothetical protein